MSTVSQWVWLLQVALNELLSIADSSTDSVTAAQPAVSADGWCRRKLALAQVLFFFNTSIVYV